MYGLPTSQIQFAIEIPALQAHYLAGRLCKPHALDCHHLRRSPMIDRHLSRRERAWSPNRWNTFRQAMCCRYWDELSRWLADNSWLPTLWCRSLGAEDDWATSW